MLYLNKMEWSVEIILMLDHNVKLLIPNSKPLISPEIECKICFFSIIFLFFISNDKLIFFQLNSLV